MTDAIDDHFRSTVASWLPGDGPAPAEPAALLALFDAQVVSRHLDLAARVLQTVGEGFYTIGSAGHESNAAVAMALRPTDPALLHYRSGGFYVARAAQVDGTDPIADVLNGVAAAAADQISGGRHKVFGNRELSIIPQTSTIGSHLPRAFGLAYAIGRRDASTWSSWPNDAVVVTSFGDASLNHSTTLGALNAAGYLAHQGVPVPLLAVCEDNGLGISTPSPHGWVERRLAALPGFLHLAVDGSRPDELLEATAAITLHVRSTRQPAVLHLRTVRYLGHAGSDAEVAYRTSREIVDDLERDPLLATARRLVESGVLSPAQVLDRYESARVEVEEATKRVIGSPRLTTAEAVTAPLDRSVTSDVVVAEDEVRRSVFEDRLPEDAGPLTLAQTINAALKDVLAAHPEAIVLGEDVGRKGGVYGVTRGLSKVFGRERVLDTLLDEQTVLGTSLGLALAGRLPIPEIQYLAYVHNAEDQLRGEAATLPFFSDGQYENGMVVRVAGLAYQKGFGGHFHNDNALAVLRDVPGLRVAVPSHPHGAARLLRECVRLAHDEGRVCVFVEPIALYHRRDLFEDGDAVWTAPYEPAGTDDVGAPVGEVSVSGDGRDCLVVTFGNGVPMSLRAALRLAADHIDVTVLDLQWLSPLPTTALLEVASGYDRVLVVDETRASGGVSESVVTALVTGGYRGQVDRVTSADSFVPLGPAADAVLLGEDDVVDAVRRLVSG